MPKPHDTPSADVPLTPLPEPCTACIEAAARTLNFDRSHPVADDAETAPVRPGYVYIDRHTLDRAAVVFARRDCPHMPISKAVAQEVLELPLYVFFFSEGREVIRIGESWTPLRRFDTICAEYPRELRILGVISKYTLKDIKKMFKEEWIHGEWYEFTDELADFVKKHHDESFSAQTEAVILRRREILVDHERAEAMKKLTAQDRGLLGLTLHTRDALDAALEDDETVDVRLRASAEKAETPRAPAKAAQTPARRAVRKKA